MSDELHFDGAESRVLEAVRLIQDCEAPFWEACSDTNALQEPVKLMLSNGLSFARNTIEAIQEQLEKKRIQQAEILLRSLFETATRLLYASRKANGWQRLQADAASKDRRWAQRAMNCPDLRPIAQAVLENGQRVARLQEAKALPDVREMVRTIDRRFREDEGRGDKAETAFGEYSYSTVYAITSRATHGHILALAEQANEATGRFISAATVQATFMIVRAVHHALRWDTEQLSQRALRILQSVLNPDRSNEEE